MSFSGTRAAVLVGVLVALGVAVFKFGLPGWLLPLGLVATGIVLRGAENHTSE
jgi:hypothetical protein